MIVRDARKGPRHRWRCEPPDRSPCLRLSLLVDLALALALLAAMVAGLVIFR